MGSILITGANGFVGSNLCGYLHENGYIINVLQRSESAGENVFEKIFAWDSLQQKYLENTDAVIHLAGKAHDTNNVSEPQTYFDINYGLTKKIFDFFLKSTAKDFIFFSSVKAVADTVTGILDESSIPDPQTPYGQSKLQAEQYLLNAHLPTGKRVIILRPCMIHGPGNKGNLNLLYGFVKRGIPYPLAAYKNKRSFLSVLNLCYIVKKILQQPSVPSGIYNVADDEPLNVTDAVRIISETAGKKARLISVPPKLMNIFVKAGDLLKLPLNSERLKKMTESYMVSNNKIKSVLHIDSLPLSSKEGLIKTIESFLF